MNSGIVYASVEKKWCKPRMAFCCEAPSGIRSYHVIENMVHTLCSRQRGLAPTTVLIGSDKVVAKLVSHTDCVSLFLGYAVL